MLRKNRAVIKPIRIELNDDHKKVSSLVVLLIAIDKRMAVNADADTKRSRSKKTKKIDVGKLYKEGSQSRGSFLFIKQLKPSLRDSLFYFNQFFFDHLIYPCKS